MENSSAFKTPILSDAEPPIMEEPTSPSQTVEPAVLKVSLEVFCCPCPKEKRDECENKDCDCTCAHKENDCTCARKENDCAEDKDNCCQRWFPFFSRVSN